MKNRVEIARALAASGYIADNELATAISLMLMLKRPLLLEGEAGVGKTEVAKALCAPTLQAPGSTATCTTAWTTR
jgi:MoxR-like ATPase